MIKDIFFSVQLVLLVLSGCGASDLWYKGELDGINAVIIIIACVMSAYSAVMCYLRTSTNRGK